MSAQKVAEIRQVLAPYLKSNDYELFIVAPVDARVECAVMACSLESGSESRSAALGRSLAQWFFDKIEGKWKLRDR